MNNPKLLPSMNFKVWPDLKQLAQDFPLLEASGPKLAYLDNAATTQKPAAVIQAIADFYTQANANVGRSVYPLAEQATLDYEAARTKLAAFIGATCAAECVFTASATAAINLLATSLVATDWLQPGDAILLSQLEHHANLLPWQQLARQKQLRLLFLPVNLETGTLSLEQLASFLQPEQRVKLVAITHVSNTLGSVTDLKAITQAAKAAGALVLADGAQALLHLPVQVADLGVDFYVGSAHKFWGPTGLGFLYGRYELLEALPAYQIGGGMVLAVSWQESTWQLPPAKFEAGTPALAAVQGLAAALDYIASLRQHYGLATLHNYMADLASYAYQQLIQIPGLTLLGAAGYADQHHDLTSRLPIFSFVIPGIHAHDLGSILGQYGVAVRVGHHCTMPLMQLYGVAATTRASLCYYNTRQDIDALIAGLQQAVALFKRF